MFPKSNSLRKFWLDYSKYLGIIYFTHSKNGTKVVFCFFARKNSSFVYQPYTQSAEHILSIRSLLVAYGYYNLVKSYWNIKHKDGSSKSMLFQI